MYRAPALSQYVCAVTETQTETGRPRRGMSRSVTVLRLIALLAVVGLIVSVPATLRTVSSYHAKTVHLQAAPPGAEPLNADLPPGSYTVFVGCEDFYGCPSIHPDQLSIQGYGSDPSMAAVTTRPQVRVVGGQKFSGVDTFTIQAKGGVWYTLRPELGQPAFIAPSESLTSTLLPWTIAAISSVTVLLGATFTLARRRPSPPD